jgi:hypothetical protein
MGSLDSSIHVQMTFINTTHDKKVGQRLLSHSNFGNLHLDHVEMMNGSDGVM